MGRLLLHNICRFKILITLMMEAVSFSETMVIIHQTTWCNIPGDSHLHTHRCKNLKSHGIHQSQTFRAGIPNLFYMATHLTKPPRFRDTPLTVRPPPPPSTRLENKIHNYIIKTNEANLTARFSYLIIYKAEFRLMTSNFRT
jgi:hypothetical protein